MRQLYVQDVCEWF